MSSVLTAAIIAARSELVVQVADSPALVREAHRLRHQVYSLERGYIVGQEQTRLEGLEVDGYDAHSSHIVLRMRDSGEVIGTARLILPLPGHERPGYRSFPMQGVCDPALFQQLPSRGMAEVSRFAVSKERRGLSTGSTGLSRLALVRGLVQLSQMEGVTHWCATMERTLLRLLRASGIHFQDLGPVVDYYGPRQPAFCHVGAMLERMHEEQPEIWGYVTEHGQFTDAGFADADLVGRRPGRFRGPALPLGRSKAACPSAVVAPPAIKARAMPIEAAPAVVAGTRAVEAPVAVKPGPAIVAAVAIVLDRPHQAAGLMDDAKRSRDRSLGPRWRHPGQRSQRQCRHYQVSSHHPAHASFLSRCASVRPDTVAGARQAQATPTVTQVICDAAAVRPAAAPGAPGTLGM